MLDDKSLVKENLSMLVNVGSVDEHFWYTCNACATSCRIGT